MTTNTAWPQHDGHVRRGGVSSFGISGTNAHVVLAEPPVKGTPEEVTGDAGGLVPWVVSGRTAAAVRAQAGRLA
ncbi:ketoacyl-synthetase C-terminal extension domain-containing protein, partial [Streptomyces sp. ECR2.10]|uniref:ketoacyl-synthetase C-terminal extension domain-containing protein n=1 Tax=Streptomyces sp. ECR2.10 TaxID=3461012 RepID=UPI004041A33B